VANPYASYYQLQKQEMSNTDFEHTTGSVYVRTGADLNSRSLATYNTLSGIATPADYKGIIAPMQAFWVRRETPGNIVMKQANRIHDGARSALKSASVGELDLLRLQLTNGRSNDEAVVAFRENGSLMLSRFDSEKRFDKEDQVTPYIYTMKEKQATVINMMPQVMSKQTVMLGLRIPDIDEEQLRLTVVGMETLNENVAVYLEDKATGAMIDLRSQSIYDFSAKAATINDRLVLHFNEAISTDIENPQADESVSVYAYQNGGELMVFENLLADRPNGKVRIELFSITGSKVVERTFNASGLHALPANLASGTYLVKVFAHENEPYVVKVVIR